MKDIDINKIKEEIKEVGHKTDFIVSWFAKKYNKVIFRPGNLNEVGCRTWTHATNGDKYLCFYDTLKHAKRKMNIDGSSQYITEILTVC